MLNLSEKQKNIIEDLKLDTGGFGNGHVYYMFAGIKEDMVGSFVEYLDEIDKEMRVIFCELFIEQGSNGLYNIYVHAHEKYPSDVIELVSEKFPELTCYWNDCWDYEGTMYVFQKGSVVENYKDVCKVVIEEDEVNPEIYADETYYETTAEVTDLKTGASFIIGGGCISEDQRNLILDYVRETA